MKTFAIYWSGDHLMYVEMHETEEDCWRIYLGWPTKGEVRDKQACGFRCVEVSIMPVTK